MRPAKMAAAAMATDAVKRTSTAMKRVHAQRRRDSMSPNSVLVIVGSCALTAAP